MIFFLMKHKPNIYYCFLPTIHKTNNIHIYYLTVKSIIALDYMYK